jgi:hypothetical protein
LESDVGRKKNCNSKVTADADSFGFAHDTNAKISQEESEKVTGSQDRLFDCAAHNVP